MGIINEKNRDYYLRRMINHYRRYKSEEEIIKNVKENPEVLEGFAEYVDNLGYEVVKLRKCENTYYE